MTFHRTCDGVVRRDFLKLGALGAGGLSLSNYLRWTHAASPRPKGEGSHLCQSSRWPIAHGHI